MPTKRNLKEQISLLREKGKTLKEIQSALQCSLSTIAYHLYDKTKTNVKCRALKNKKSYHDNLKNRTTEWLLRFYLNQKRIQFFRFGRKRKTMGPITFTLDQLINKLLENPVCYLTGITLNLNDPKSISLDHKVPISRGGSSNLDNLGFCFSWANQVKTDLLESELTEFCIQYLRYRDYKILDKDQM